MEPGIPETTQTSNTNAVDGAQLDEVTGALEALVAALDHNGDLNTLLQQVCQQVTQVVPGADMASVTLIRGDTPETAACTDDRVYQLDLDQYAAGNGPCLEAAATGKLVRLNLADAEQHWPTFTRAAREAGAGSYLSAPLVVDTRHSGALNLYGAGSHGYEHADASLLEVYLTAVEGALRATARYLQAQQVVDQLREALATRPIIDQAKGILMGAHTIPAGQAFDILVTQSQQEHRKLHDIAADLVTHATTPGTNPS